ncbi:MAG: amidohydrolase family protein, partial [Limisphaerales bacterium]
MKPIERAFCALALTFWLGAGAAEKPAELVVLNGKVVTMDAASRRVSAVAVREGVFVAVGANDEARKFIGAGTRVIDAKGRMVVPGLIETHVHATGAARGEVTQPFVQLGSIGEIQDWVRRKIAASAPGAWIQLPRVDVTRIRERRLPARADLDAAAPTHPAVFTWQYANRQVQVLNSTALRVAGVTKDTKPPGSGKIHLGPDGSPTGMLENCGALTLKFMPSRTVPEDVYHDSLVKLLQNYNEVGITSIFERNSNVEGFRTYEKLKAAGRLTTRVTVTIGLGTDGTVEGTEKAIRAIPFKTG